MELKLGKNTFKHGIHPPEHKEETRHFPIRQFVFPPVIVLPLIQHIGAVPKVQVTEGQEVSRGQLLAKEDGFLSVPLHAPVSGLVKKIGRVPAINGKMVPGIYLETFPSSTQEVMNGVPVDLETASPKDILSGIQKAGIVGLGGAAFPTHVKLNIPEGKTCETLIINGIECEPFLTTDHRVMLEQPDDILLGIRYLLKASGAKKAIIGIESNKQDAADHLSKYLINNDRIHIQVVPVKYPQGAEKMLITSLLGSEVPSGSLPIDIGALVVNVATAAEIGLLLPLGRGIQERVVTITGPGIKVKGNYLVPIGTPLRFILDKIGVDRMISEVYMGGPMMGVAVSNLDISVVKGTSGIVAFTETEIRNTRKVYPCIKCGACLEACPISLNPSKLGLLAKSRAYDVMSTDYHLMDCFECGSCSYVCPSHIPLVQYFRLSKSMVRKRKAS